VSGTAAGRVSFVCWLRSQTSRWRALAHGMVGAEACGRDRRSGDDAGMAGAQRNNRTAELYVRKARRRATQAECSDGHGRGAHRMHH
jgi:hypothetical protein